MSDRTALKAAEAALHAHHRAGIRQELADIWIARMLDEDGYTAPFLHFCLVEVKALFADDPPQLNDILRGETLDRSYVDAVERASLKVYPPGIPAFYAYSDRAALRLADAIGSAREGGSDVILPEALADYAWEMATAISGAGATLLEMQTKHNEERQR